MMKWINAGIPLPLGALNNKRSLIGVNNLASFIVECIDNSAAANQTFFVSDGYDVSTTELLHMLAKALGCSSRLLPVPEGWLRMAGILLGKQQMMSRLCGSLQVDISKAHNMLGWHPPYTMDYEMAITGRYFLNSLLGHVRSLNHKA